MQIKIVIDVISYNLSRAPKIIQYSSVEERYLHVLCLLRSDDGKLQQNQHKHFLVSVIKWLWKHNNQILVDVDSFCFRSFITSTQFTRYKHSALHSKLRYHVATSLPPPPLAPNTNIHTTTNMAEIDKKNLNIQLSCDANHVSQCQYSVSSVDLKYNIIASPQQQQSGQSHVKLSF